MLTRTHTRLQVSGPDAAAAASFTLPMRLVVDRPTAEAALSEARRVADSLAAAAANFAPAGSQLTVVSPASRSELSLEQRRRDDVRLCLTLVLKIDMPAANDYWVRAMSFARAADFAERFAQQSHGKGIEIEVGGVEPVAATHPPSAVAA